jgi:transposase InsO family protein
VVQQLEWLMAWRGVPDHVRSDNGPEFIAKRVRHWLRERSCETIYITPGSPWENPYIESFFDKLRGEYLNQTLFSSIQAAQSLLDDWRHDYNHDRLHSSLGYQTPLEFVAQFNQNNRLLPPDGEVDPKPEEILSLAVGK